MTRPFLVALISALVLLATTTLPAVAQDGTTDALLEREQLTARIADLEAELSAARKRIAELKAEIANLKAGGASSSTGSPPAANPFADPALPPMANPIRTFVEIRKDFADETEKDGQGDPGDAGNDTRKAYVKWAKNWIAGINKKYRKRIEWPVRVDEIRNWNTENSYITLTTLGPDGRLSIEDPFTVEISRRLADRIQRALTNRTKDDPQYFMLNGVFVPRVSFNQGRLEQGPFNNPPFIGPMVEYNWTVDVSSIAPPVKPKQRP
ncbi:MAG: septum formation initiator family protein [Phycisphaerales bacterium]|nr:septum formation initiator family protein [Phycisphaerales bacterium]